MPRPARKPGPIKLWVILDHDGNIVGTHNGSLFTSQGEAMDTAEACGHARRAVQAYGRCDPKPRKAHPFRAGVARG